MTYHILLIEDDLQICEIITDYLTAQQENVFCVRCANDGERGLEQIVEGQYDLVLLDMASRCAGSFAGSVTHRSFLSRQGGARRISCAAISLAVTTIW